MGYDRVLLGAKMDRRAEITQYYKVLELAYIMEFYI